jgi:hypothetical protein
VRVFLAVGQWFCYISPLVYIEASSVGIRNAGRVLILAGRLLGPVPVRGAVLTHHHPACTLQQLTVIKLISYFLICPRNYSTANSISLHNAEKEGIFL